MRFSGVTLVLFYPVKPISKVSDDKEDRYLQCLCTSISSGAGASY